MLKSVDNGISKFTDIQMNAELFKCNSLLADRLTHKTLTTRDTS